MNLTVTPIGCAILFFFFSVLPPAETSSASREAILQQDVVQQDVVVPRDGKVEFSLAICKHVVGDVRESPTVA